MSISLADQIKCIERELALRRNVYKKFVAGGRMKQAHADSEISTMEAVLDTLLAVLDSRATAGKVPPPATEPYDLSSPDHPANKR